MSASSEALSFQPTLKTLLGYAKLSIPLFQRPYSWGGPEKENAAKSYFSEYLADPHAVNFFGFIILYSPTRHDFKNDTNVEVHIADGQHRLVTVVLAAMAVQDALDRLMQTKDAGAVRQASELLSRNQKLLSALTNSNIEVKLAPGAQPIRLKDFIKEQTAQLEHLKLERAQIQLAYQESRREISRDLGTGKRREAGKKKTLDRNHKLKRVGQLEKDLEGIFAWRSYQLLKGVLDNPGDPGFHECLGYCREFLKRLNEYYVHVTCLVSRHNGGESLGALESEAFMLFIQSNSRV